MTVHVNLPDRLEKQIDREWRARGFDSLEAFMIAALEAQVSDDTLHVPTLSTEIKRGRDSGAVIPVNDEYWANKIAALESKYGKKAS